jgi:ParB-like chromosome segregation protein Spo0J
MRMAELTEKDKKLLNCLFQALLNKGKAKSIIEVKKAVDEVVTSMNGLMQFDGAMFEHARNNGVEKEFQDKIMEEEINLKNEEKDEIKENQSKPIENEKKPVKKMENQNEETQNTQNNTIDWRNLPKTEEEQKPKKQRILIEGDAVVEKVDLIFNDKIETTEKGAKFQRCPIVITFKSDAGDEVVEYYGGCRRWVNDDGTYSAPQFQKGGNSAVAKIFNRFCKKINVAEEQAQLFHLMQFLSEKPKCMVFTEDVLNPSTKTTIPKNAIMKFI